MLATLILLHFYRNMFRHRTQQVPTLPKTFPELHGRCPNYGASGGQHVGRGLRLRKPPMRRQRNQSESDDRTDDDASKETEHSAKQTIKPPQAYPAHQPAKNAANNAYQHDYDNKDRKKCGDLGWPRGIHEARVKRGYLGILPGCRQIRNDHTHKGKKLAYKPTGDRLYDGKQNDEHEYPVEDRHAHHKLSLPRQRTPGELGIRFNVLLARLRSHFRRQGRRWRLLVPFNGFQVVAHVLLVERLLCAASFVFILRPETRRIRCQHFVSEYQSAWRAPKFELGIGNDDAAGFRVVGSRLIDLDAEIPQLLAQFAAGQLHHAVEGNILIVPAAGLDSGGKDRLRQLIGFAQSFGQRNPAHF